jgi:hypothetical protein
VLQGAPVRARPGRGQPFQPDPGQLGGLDQVQLGMVAGLPGALDRVAGLHDPLGAAAVRGLVDRLVAGAVDRRLELAGAALGPLGGRAAVP